MWVALWDVHRIFPALNQIAGTMTQAQSRYGFDTVSLPAPLGMWRRQQSAQGAYLNATQVAQHLEGKPKQLGVQGLICITNFPLRDKGTLDLYAWSDPESQIAIFSTAGLLDQIKEPELSLSRMIANGVVGILADLEEHKRGVKDCPSYYNPKRDIRYVAGPLHWCSPCRRRLAGRKENLTALDRLLRVFD